jgi:hypothetical protein
MARPRQGTKRKPKPAPSYPTFDVEKEKKRLAPLLPDIDPHDLDLILHSLARPFGTGKRFFLRKARPGVRIF